MSNYTNSTNILGLDCSHWQNSIDWAKAKADGIHFAFVKITEGDYHFEGNYYSLKARCQEIKKQGIKLGYYHFCTPGHIPDPVENAKIEAQKFIKHLADLPESDLPLVLDCESYPGFPDCYNVPVIWPKNGLTKYMQTFISELNKEVIIYTNKWIWTDKENFKIYPLWVPDYSGKEKLAMPVGWTNWD